MLELELNFIYVMVIIFIKYIVLVFGLEDYFVFFCFYLSLCMFIGIVWFLIKVRCFLCISKNGFKWF